MLYKVTPMMTPPGKAGAKQSEHTEGDGANVLGEPLQGKQAKEPRKRRKSAVFDADGNEVLITMMCLKCRSMKPLGMFGLRKMADGAIRNQPWCRTCRSGAGTGKKKGAPTLEAPASTEGAQLTAQPKLTPVEERSEANAPGALESALV